MLPTLSVIIPTHQKNAPLARTLALLRQQSLSPDAYEIVVVDNALSQETRQLVEEAAHAGSPVSYVSEGRRGPGAARNAGIRHARGDYLLFLDDDIEVRPDHLARHLALHRAYPNSAILGSILDTYPMRPAFLQRYLAARNRLGSRPHAGGAGSLHALDDSYFITGNVSLPREALRRIATPDEQGGPSCYFDESLRMREDADMGYRLAGMGVRLLRDDDLLCQHYHPRTWQELLRRSYWAGYYMRHLVRKHPALAARQRHLYGRGKTLLLLLLSLVALPIGLLLEPLTPALLHRSISGLLLTWSNWGNQQAMNDES